ncbi:MAG: thrombospondin type 3 repeat-containing protein, partial [Myxococcota bacterium]
FGTVVTTDMQNDIPDNRWNGNPGGVVSPGSNSGDVNGTTVSFFTGLSDYRTYGDITCSGSFCASVPTGSYDSTFALELMQLDFGAGGPAAGASFTSQQITLPADPNAQPFLMLKGAETLDVYVPGQPAEQCETDTDGDGFPDAADNCPDTPNDQSDVNSDGIGDICESSMDLPTLPMLGRMLLLGCLAAGGLRAIRSRNATRGGASVSRRRE